MWLYRNISASNYSISTARNCVFNIQHRDLYYFYSYTHQYVIYGLRTSTEVLSHHGIMPTMSDVFIVIIFLFYSGYDSVIKYRLLITSIAGVANNVHYIIGTWFVKILHQCKLY
jgi:hypothetical protein